MSATQELNSSQLVNSGVIKAMDCYSSLALTNTTLAPGYQKAPTACTLEHFVKQIQAMIQFIPSHYLEKPSIQIVGQDIICSCDKNICLLQSYVTLLQFDIVRDSTA